MRTSKYFCIWEVGINGRAALAQRAFQDVPRTLRRRSASHNVKRVPRQLREKARREMVADGTKPASKPRGRVRLAMEKKRLAAKSVKQVIDDTAMEMDVDVEVDADVDTEVDGLAPKLKPRKVTKGKFANRQEDKTWLPTHLYHAKRSRVDYRWGFSLPLTPTEKSFRPTYRASHHSGFIAFDTSYFATLFVQGTEDKVRQLLDMVTEPGSAAASKRYSSGKRSCETVLYRHGEFPRGMIGPALVLWQVVEGGRQVMIRVHPACVEEVWKELHSCATEVGNVRIEDARFEIGAIDLFGPLSTEVLFAVLNVGKGVCSKVWEQLSGLRDPGSLPLGAVLNLDLRDPRTAYTPSRFTTNISFPPRKRKQSPSPELSSLIKEWPQHIPGPTTLFNSTSRCIATKYIQTHTRGSLQKTRNELLNSGQPPHLPLSDPIIPSVLLRRDSNSWTLLLPWSWVNEFWYSFMHYPESRFGAITEYAQICFEKRGMGFPEDFPGTRAGDEELRRRREQEEEKWRRRPDGKRESWGKVLKKGDERGEVGDPFGCDWTILTSKETTVNGEDEVMTDGVDLQTIKERAKAAMGIDSANPRESTDHFLLSPGYAKQLLTRKSPMMATLDVSHALLPIRLRFLQKGNVAFRARIYRLPTSLEARQQWLDLLNKNIPTPSKQGYPACPGEGDLLGFVTTGNMSLSEGRGRSVGALAWNRVELEEERWSEEKEFRRWCIVRDVGHDVGRLAKWEVND